jgi:hypothetical protein
MKIGGCRMLNEMRNTYKMMMILIMIMSIGRENVSELRLPAGLLFILQVIYLHAEPRCIMSTGGKFPIRPPELSLEILPAEPSSQSGGSG